MAIQAVFDVLELPIDVEKIEDEKMRQTMDAKVVSFKYAKQIMDAWQNSPNAPSKEVLSKYVYQLVGLGDASLMELRDALRKQIDVDSIDKTKLAPAVKAKAIILDYIQQLNSQLVELRLQLGGDTFQLGEREFTLGFPERFARGDFYPASNYHNEWYNAEEDAIMICPKGTKGEILEIDGLRIQLPKPPRKSKMLFADRPKKEQYWRRTPLPDGCTPKNEAAYTEYILEEYRRRREGVWFMNNGEPVYLTGHAYFALQWGRMLDDGGYMEFRYAQLDMFYFAEAVIRDHRSLGMIFVKGRRTGFTYMVLSMFLNDATSTQNVNLGMTSQNDSDAKKAFKKFAYMFRSLPFFFRPVVKGAFASDTSLEFNVPDDKSKAAKLAKDYKGTEYLNTFVDYESTTDGSYDGQKLFRYLGDEAGKWKKPANYQNHWGRIAPTFELTGKIVGKAFIGSTVNPMHLGGEEFMNIFYESLIKDRSTVTGRTPSGLYAMFLPANKNMSVFTDIYGRCYETAPEKKTLNTYGEEITMGSIDFLNGRRKAKRAKSDIAYNEELRANPMTIDEAFRDSAETAIFSIEKINEQIAYIKSLNLSHLVTRGNFMWKNGVVDSEVVWVPDRNGRFDITWFPPVEHRNLKVKKDGMWYPASPVNGCFGCDPFDIGGTVSGKGSKGAMSGVTGFDMTGAPSNFFFLEYVNRTEIADTFFEDVLMACVFYGLPVLVENNKPRLLIHFRNRGYRGFALNRPDKPLTMLSPNEKMYGGIPSSSKDIVITHASQIENFIVNFVGVYTEEDEEKQVREYASMGNMYFYETLKDWLKFDITKREKSDLTIASGYALMGLNRAQFLKAPEIKPINVGLVRYDNSGERSRIIR